MNGFTEGQRRALRALLSVWNAEKFVVVGANAVHYHLGLGERATYDLDLSVAAAPGTIEFDLEKLGWVRDTASLQRWHSEENERIDIIPASKAAIEAGGFTWQDGSARMSLVGFRMAHENAAPVPIGESASVRVATLPSLVVLKIAAYLDRPYERERDLVDLAHVLEHAVADDSPDRWAPEIVERALGVDDVSPFILGQRVGMQADADELRTVRTFVRYVLEGSPGETLIRWVRAGGALWRADPEIAERRIRSFREGLRSVRPDVARDA